MFEIRPLPEEQIDAMLGVGTVAYHRPTLEGAEYARRRAFLAGAQRVGAYEGNVLGGVAAAIDMELSVPGGASLPASGVTWVAVLPTHRRRGALGGMMRRLFAQARERGVPLAALWASEGAIYGRFGFGAAVRALALDVDPRLGLRIEPDPRPVRLALPGDLGQAIAAISPVHERERGRRGGMAARSDAAWRLLLEHGGPEGLDEGVSAARVAVLGDPAAGYATYRSRPGPDEGSATIAVEELVADDVAGAAALWRFLGSIDLIERVSAWNLPLDDPLPLIAADPDHVRLTGAPVGNWLRLLDLPAALRARGGGADVSARVHDADVPENDGTWHLGSGEPAATADLELDTRDLAALYLGGVTPTALHRTGLLREHTAGAAARLDAAWRTALAPYGPDDY